MLSVEGGSCEAVSWRRDEADGELMIVRATAGSINEDRPSEEVGLLHANNDRQSRGGFSLYIPEYLDKSQATPLVIALHGGTGHGATGS